MRAQVRKIVQGRTIVGFPIGTRTNIIAERQAISVFKDTQNERVRVKTQPEVTITKIVDVARDSRRRSIENGLCQDCQRRRRTNF